jgi:hypothetical protein
MGTRTARWSSLAGATLIVFGLSVVVGLKLLPDTRRDIDYLVIGCIATLLSLCVVFFMLLASWMKLPNPFYRKRLKEVAGTEAPQNQ